MSAFDKYSTLLLKAKSLAVPKFEKNIFSIGGRGHYENPISDLLAFFMDPNEVHKLDDLFLRSLFQCMGISPSGLELKSVPEREVCTRRGNRIDLMLEGNDWVMVIENKIEASSGNPFDDYVQYAKSIHRAKNFHFVLMSIREEEKRGEWLPIKWEAYLKRVTKNLSEVSERLGSSKWPILAKEFVLNVQQQCGGAPMNNERFDFVLKNYEMIEEIKLMREQFPAVLMEAVKKIITVSTIQCDQLAPVKSFHDVQQKRKINEEWFRFYFVQGTRWHHTNIALRLKNNGMFLLSVYLYGLTAQSFSVVREVIDESSFRELSSESNGKFFLFETKSELDYNSVMKQIEDVVRRLTQIMAEDSSKP